ncbi:MaoC family dehydratase [Bosea sp. PAMC 26642]|uniref:MaoC family dehydratase n=1 Tax=Bosea sp. (strain PAMC 26642) TaxID=1792307 RepID=UPI0007703E15|nr:MaoC family dehydratase [Bosea sp. PAMC 26642]AMJ60857.1 dehydratase [Bosea sp. PAMC 26642]
MLFFEDFIVGDTVQAGRILVGQADILAYADRFDAQDFHTDPKAAQESFVGTLIASGWHSCSLLMRLICETFILDSAGMGAPGVEEVKWLRPVKPDDTLAARRTVLETKASRSRPEMGLVRFRFELLNQHDEPVLEQINWIMFGRRGAAILPHVGDWLAHSPRYAPPTTQSPLEPPSEAPEPALFFEEMKIGAAFELGSLVFTADEIIAFARSFDPQPFHMDEAAARDSAFGRLAASGWHTASVWMAAMVSHRKRQIAALGSAPAPRLGPSPGFRNLRWSKPVFAGDRITYHSTITDKRASASRPQWGLFFHRNTGVNQHGEEVFSFDGCVFVERRT